MVPNLVGTRHEQADGKGARVTAQDKDALARHAGDAEAVRRTARRGSYSLLSAPPRDGCGSAGWPPARRRASLRLWRRATERS